MLAPFATLVVFHNLVTSTVDSKFLRNKHRSYFCLKEASDAMRDWLGFAFHPQENVLATDLSDALPGIRRHRLLDCASVSSRRSVHKRR
mmetsp:Transcript_18221/g.49993  ORF Transcript_18221/g.49993 Transcript_18221/m.49993 type:complete len:89 (-) Transcript_18221:192-458(-)